MPIFYYETHANLISIFFISFNFSFWFYFNLILISSAETFHGFFFFEFFYAPRWRLFQLSGKYNVHKILLMSLIRCVCHIVSHRSARDLYSHCRSPRVYNCVHASNHKPLCDIFLFAFDKLLYVFVRLCSLRSLYGLRVCRAQGRSV